MPYLPVINHHSLNERAIGSYARSTWAGGSELSPRYTRLPQHRHHFLRSRTSKLHRQRLSESKDEIPDSDDGEELNKSDVLATRRGLTRYLAQVIIALNSRSQNSFRVVGT